MGVLRPMHPPGTRKAIFVSIHALSQNHEPISKRGQDGADCATVGLMIEPVAPGVGARIAEVAEGWWRD